MNRIRTARRAVAAWIDAHPVTVFYLPLFGFLWLSMFGPEIHPGYYIGTIGGFIIAPLLRKVVDRGFDLDRMRRQLESVTAERNAYRNAMDDMTEKLRAAAERASV